MNESDMANGICYTDASNDIWMQRVHPKRILFNKPLKTTLYVPTITLTMTLLIETGNYLQKIHSSKEVGHIYWPIGSVQTESVITDVTNTEDSDWQQDIYIYIYIYIQYQKSSTSKTKYRGDAQGKPPKAPIYIIITKNIRYLLWNRGLWRSLDNTYPIFLNPCIRYTNHLCDSCDLTDVNSHSDPVTAPNDSKCWPIVTSSKQEAVASNCDVTMTDCSNVCANIYVIWNRKSSQHSFFAKVIFLYCFVTTVFQHGASLVGINIL